MTTLIPLYWSKVVVSDSYRLRTTKNFDGQPEITTWLSVGQPPFNWDTVWKVGPPAITKPFWNVSYNYLRNDSRLQKKNNFSDIFEKKLNKKKFWKKYTSGPRYWNVPVLVNTGTFLAYQYCLKTWYLHSLECASVIQKLTILEHKNDLVLSSTRVPVSGTWSILFPKF